MRDILVMYALRILQFVADIVASFSLYTTSASAWFILCQLRNLFKREKGEGGGHREREREKTPEVE